VHRLRRNLQQVYRSGGRAYFCAGLPGAEDADVDLDEVDRFFTDLDLWDGLI
jgi:hypothetical protein